MTDTKRETAVAEKTARDPPLLPPPPATQLAPVHDPRRHGVIEVEYRSGLYRLKVAGQLWASVEWSPRRKAWCIEDGVARCLAHVEHIHGKDPDPAIAVRLAKRMIRDGRMPTPEEAQEALQQRRSGRRHVPRS